MALGWQDKEGGRGQARRGSILEMVWESPTVAGEGGRMEAGAGKMAEDMPCCMVALIKLRARYR